MEQYKKEFIDFMLESKVLKFGDFTLKSGRKSPFFMNAGGYVTGNQLKRLGEYYAKAIVDQYGKDGSLTLTHSQNSQMSFMYGFFFVKFLFFTVVCVVIMI